MIGEVEERRRVKERESKGNGKREWKIKDKNIKSMIYEANTGAYTLNRNYLVV